MGDSGIYFLLIRLKKSVELEIRRTRAKFPSGFYIYTGSAQKNLNARIRRHRAKNKKMHWHIDYLLEFADVIDVKILRGAARKDEEHFAKRWIKIADFIPLKKFGASDSKAETHLVGFKTKKKIIKSDLWE